ncbi:MAG: ABC transporter ATP-binding protein [bacterium]
MDDSQTATNLSPAGHPLLECRGLHCQRGRHTVIKGIALQLHPGEITVLLGLNGAGKSTLLQLLSGCLNDYRGEILIQGKALDNHPRMKNLLGYLPDSPPIYPDITVEEQLQFSAQLHGLRSASQRENVVQALEACQLEEKRHTLISSLSKGYRQRVGLAQAILHKPRILLLDEPTEGLDPGQILHLRRLLLHLAKQGVAILLSTHLLDEARNIAHHLHVFRDGTLMQVDMETVNSQAGQTLETLYEALLDQQPGEEQNS